MADNFRITQNNVAQHRQQLDAALSRAFTMIGMRGSRNVASIAPVDTGNLKSHIDYSSTSDMVTIGTNVKYAIYQEMGTIKMSAANGGKGFLRFGIENSANDFRRILQEELKNL